MSTNLQGPIIYLITSEPTSLSIRLSQHARWPEASILRYIRQKLKTYNSGDSPVVTHLTTSPPVRCLNRAERTGSLVFNVLWSYVEEVVQELNYIGRKCGLA